MDNDKKNQAGKNGQQLAPNVANDQLGENNGESSCGCGGSRPGNTDKSAGKNTCR